MKVVEPGAEVTIKEGTELGEDFAISIVIEPTSPYEVDRLSKRGVTTVSPTSDLGKAIFGRPADPSRKIYYITNDGTKAWVRIMSIGKNTY